MQFLKTWKEAIIIVLAIIAFIYGFIHSANNYSKERGVRSANARQVTLERFNKCNNQIECWSNGTRQTTDNVPSFKIATWGEQVRFADGFWAYAKACRCLNKVKDTK